MSNIKYDLTTDGFWETLDNGLHTVSVVAKAIGYQDSDKAEYQFVKEPNTDMINIQLYQCTAERNRVNKIDYMTLVDSIFGVLREETSIVSPDITVEGKTLPTFNYVYIREFNRYYYVSDITAVRNNLWLLTLDVDVLMSYNTAIRQCVAYVDRNENTYNKKIVDTKLPLEQGETVQETFIDNALFNTPITNIDREGSFVIQGIGVVSAESDME